MQISRSNSFKAICNRIFCRRDTYVTDSGCKFTMKRGKGKVDVTSGNITISDAKNLKILDSAGNDNITVNSSSIQAASFTLGQDLVTFNNCEFKFGNDRSYMSEINTSSDDPNSSTKIVINGDFKGAMRLADPQQILPYYGAPVKKDELVINGSNYGVISTGNKNNVTVNGYNSGSIISRGEMVVSIYGKNYVVGYGRIRPATLEDIYYARFGKRPY